MTTIFPTGIANGIPPEMATAIIAITARGAGLGRVLVESIPGLTLHVSSRYVEQGGEGCRTFHPAELRSLITSLWYDVDGFILIMATGIVVRMIAPLLHSKVSDPAVVVMDEAGTFAIPLLSGHLGGANRLARQCGELTGALPVITTATDTNNLPSFDMLAKESGLVIDDIGQVKHLNRLLLDHHPIALIDPDNLLFKQLHDHDTISRHDTWVEACVSGARGFVLVSNRQEPVPELLGELLILRPVNLVLGIGCNRGTPAREIEEFVTRHLQEQSLSLKSVCAIATITAKGDEAGLVEYARQLGVPLRCFNSEQLNRVVCPSPPSPYALAAVGATGVAEPAALLASGGGNLLLGKVKSANVTLAIAQRTGG